MATFASHIPQIVDLSTKEQMFRVDADSIVASMQNASTMRARQRWYWSIVDFVTYTVSGSFESPKRHDAVTGASGGEFPRPTLVASTPIGVSPEFCCDVIGRCRNAVSKAAAFCRTKLLGAWTVCVPFRSNGECSPALTANLLDSFFGRLHGSTRERAKTRKLGSATKDCAAYFTGVITPFDRWCHERSCLGYRDKSIFDPGIIEITKKYGIPGMLGAGAIGETVRRDKYGEPRT